MNPEIKSLQERIVKLEQIINFFVKPDRYLFQRDIELARGKSILNPSFLFSDGTNIPLGTVTGTKFGTASNQKIAFLGATAVSQQSAISAPSGGVTIDTESRNAINSIRSVLSTFGFTA